MEHQELNIEDTRFTRETPDYKFVPSPLLNAYFAFRFEYAA